jgi:hypothetical protein
MSVALTPFTGPAEPASDLTAERAVQQFVMILQNNVASGMPQLANPAAMASEMSGYLRGYVEKLQSQRRALDKLMDATDEWGDLVPTAASDPSRADLHGGPARERLEPAGGNSSGLSLDPKATLNEVKRLFALLENDMMLRTQAALLASGTQTVLGSFNTLLKSQ